VSVEEDLFRSIFRERGSVERDIDRTRKALRELESTRAALDRLEAALVQRARFGGATWSEIAADLQVGRETARRRHAAQRRQRS